MATVADRAEPVGAQDRETETPRVRRGSRAWRIVSGVLVGVVLAALVATVAVAASTLYADRAREAHRQALVDAAGAGVLALIGVRADTADADLDRLRALSTGTFAAELRDGGAGFVGSIRDADVNSDGRIDAAALAGESGTSAVVVVAASARVSNAAGPDGAQRTYRLRVGVDEVDGRLLMSSVEFVP
ncbi:hypothetical protein [Rhodococcus tukisamuensis]|uniref:Mce-associated membrane protein n=1 Tax=Rhodococcus tukisamuensis TaxID=168276 RepID=A0A1G6RA69_9NOCA|nr:hypothetical protein [Rhodococcus tukisamuensis]SDD01428.1 Mce-associated membrane protein [Rhodococcus tukisamuensis]